MISSGLPCRVVLGGRTLTAGKTTRKAEITSNLYGPESSYTFSVLLVRGDVAAVPRTGDRISVDGEEYRVLSVTDNGGVTLTIDLRDA